MEASQLIHYWSGTNRLVIQDPASQRKQPVSIPDAGILDPHELEEIILWQKESAAKAFSRPIFAPPPAEKRKEVGQALKEFRDYREIRRGLTGPARYYPIAAPTGASDD